MMMELLTKTSILISITLINLVKSNSTESNQTKLVEELEKEKNYLFNQINDAIDDSVKSLMNTTDSDALMNIQQMEILKERVKNLNDYKVEVKRRQGGKISDETPNQVNQTNAANETNKNKIDVIKPAAPEEDDRRSRGKKNKNANTNMNIININELMNTKYKEIKKNKKLEENRIEVQKKLDAWVAQRELEQNQNLKDMFRQKAIKERCPRYGLRGNKKRKYPCCRKCCKQSYLGCL